MKWITIILLSMMLVFACQKPEAGQVKIAWVEELEDDFSFSKQWNYPAGVYRNNFGQLSCDGFCPERTEPMKDSTGRIYQDSLVAFYALVDTTHQFHSLQGEAQCDEYAGADGMIARRRGDTVFCHSLCNPATHCSLQLRLLGEQSVATIKLQSVVPGNDVTYTYERGFLIIEEKSWKAGILKAEFDLYFGRDSLTGRPVSWKGKIYTPILN
jgi:hypothetical protein